MSGEVQGSAVAPVLVDRRDGGIFVTLNRPRARNAMSQEMIGLLSDALEAAEQDPSVRFVVLRGAGGHFCAGGDIKDMAEARMAKADGQDPIAELNARFGHIARAFAESSLPVVAVLEGAVMGGGFGLACVADIALASPTAKFALPETSLGLLPAQIAPFLIERLGLSEAKRLALTGARLGGKEALRIGLVHELHDDLDAGLASLVGTMRRCGPEANRGTKKLLRRLAPAVSSELIEEAAEAFAAAARGKEAAEGMAAFVGKRAPAWSVSEEEH